ncbi:hypothetical protein AB0H77_27635 [Streptomyces sp. NPDC050844]|uniref:hypothetical protein n=1 Tax=Streptomyces sp. NPDC050844 TaxID=3155790 RepID=UPI0033F700DD
MAELRRLKAWSGLSYRQLERRAAQAGHVLPYSTAATLLGKDRLPREELVVAFVTACGVRGSAARAWADARRTIACGPATLPPVRAEAPRQPRQPRGRRSRRSVSAWAGAAALLLAVVGGVVADGAFTVTQEVHRTQTVRAG